MGEKEKEQLIEDFERLASAKIEQGMLMTKLANNLRSGKYSIEEILNEYNKIEGEIEILEELKEKHGP